jgi:hypothetical protein
MQTQVVFDSTTSEAGWLLSASPFLLVGALLVLSGLWVAAVNWKRGWGPRLLGIGLTLILIFAVPSRYSYYHWVFFSQYLDSGPDQTVEGRVEHFLARQSGDVNFEQFTVNGVLLGYGSLGLPKCFHRPAANGGPIRTGLPVRITYNGSCIVKVEIPKPAQAQ